MTTDHTELLKRIIDAYDRFTAAEIDLGGHEVESFRAALAGCIDEADAITGRRTQRGHVVLKDLHEGWN